MQGFGSASLARSFCSNSFFSLALASISAFAFLKALSAILFSSSSYAITSWLYNEK